MTEPWVHHHREMIGPGRTLLLKLAGPWLFDDEERFPALGDLSARVQIGDFEELGRGLVINGTVQLTEVVDHLYTTALVFPAALAARSRRRWLVIGGGDGATPREALRFRDTESVRLVDISGMVIRETQRLVPSFWGGCQDDPRLHIERRDAFEVLRELGARGEQVDIVVWDLSDPGNEEVNPFADSSADHLYTSEAFRLAARCLAPGGVFVGQMAELSLVRSADHERHRRLLQAVFPDVRSYRTFIDPFGYWESFLLASDRGGDFSPERGHEVEAELLRLYDGDFSGSYSGRWHEQLFSLPPGLARRLG